MKRFRVILSALVVILAIDASDEVPAASLVTELYTRALLAESFAGAQIENVLLGDPEAHAGVYRYSSEFTVREKGKTKHCEDWHFRIKKAQRTWYVSEIAKGRCSG
ncbi:hypothetical protein [Turneriella parva]|uniref:Uncharacterized protein n=1 Tax=Turneriella parva (strain ATCC BAA-1111 / DSM 21527 / NCTC 11395 / H) TaxID=869212 RepID=I4B459_TURPD|nr:hypothetical protein [Turneriella parva]AFM12066.1 hypothetical protein Turpa_1418 [Turneriella parva DSM 21527]